MQRSHSLGNRGWSVCRVARKQIKVFRFSQNLRGFKKFPERRRSELNLHISLLSGKKAQDTRLISNTSRPFIYGLIIEPLNDQLPVGLIAQLIEKSLASQMWWLESLLSSAHNNEDHLDINCFNLQLKYMNEICNVQPLSNKYLQLELLMVFYR